MIEAGVIALSEHVGDELLVLAREDILLDIGQKTARARRPLA